MVKKELIYGCMGLGGNWDHQLLLKIVMFGLGLSLTIKDFKRIFVYPKAILIGLTSRITTE